MPGGLRRGSDAMWRRGARGRYGVFVMEAHPEAITVLASLGREAIGHAASTVNVRSRTATVGRSLHCAAGGGTPAAVAMKFAVALTGTVCPRGCLVTTGARPCAGGLKRCTGGARR